MADQVDSSGHVWVRIRFDLSDKYQKAAYDFLSPGAPEERLDRLVSSLLFYGKSYSYLAELKGETLENSLMTRFMTKFLEMAGSGNTVKVGQDFSGVAPGLSGLPEKKAVTVEVSGSDGAVFSKMAEDFF